MHLANQSLWEARQAIPGFKEARQAIPEFNGGNTLDIREATDHQGQWIQWIQRSRAEGNARSRNNPDSRLPMLQEAMIQA